MKLCSACLLGVKCRWDGESKSSDKVNELLKKDLLIPICPEQLGGLPTPRTPSEQRGNKVFTKDGKEVTEQFNRGAEEVLKIAKSFGIKEAVLKQKSPSCGCGLIYDGTFSGKLIRGNGVTTQLLKDNGIKVISEEDL
ncbi:MAG: DUF523 domain-containing protein [Candidatus Pacearchaeota archaeon]|nr:DUF523 domain-containing protein [Candidatus Pacearchaeota archaeon]